MTDTRFLDLIQAHVGGIVKLTTALETYPEMIGKIALLVSAQRAWSTPALPPVVLAKLFIEGSFQSIYAIPGDLEFLGGDDVS